MNIKLIKWMLRVDEPIAGTTGTSKNLQCDQSKYHKYIVSEYFKYRKDT